MRANKAQFAINAMQNAMLSPNEQKARSLRILSRAPQSLIAGSLVRLRAGLDSTELLSVDLRFAFTTPTMTLAR